MVEVLLAALLLTAGTVTVLRFSETEDPGDLGQAFIFYLGAIAIILL